MDLRLLLISHAATAAQRAGRFPAATLITADKANAEPLDARGIAEADAARARLALPDSTTAFVSPADCARATATALGLTATVEQALADIDYGTWHDRKLLDIANDAPHDLAAWTRDPDAAPPGGESFSQLVGRVGRWLDALDTTAQEHATARPSNPVRQVVAVTHAPLLRAAIVHALGASPAIFARIEIAPLSLVELRRSSRGWTWWPAST
jgi:broad specificity phosphatase PhoE